METPQFNESQLSELVQIRKLLEILVKKSRLPEEQWLDTADVCQRLRISLRKCAYLREKKQVKYVKKGTKIYYHVKDVDHYPDSGRRHQPLSKTGRRAGAPKLKEQS